MSRPSTYDDNITRKVADRLISRLAAQRGLRWPAAPAAARRQPDLLHAEAIKNIDPDEIEDLGRELIKWRIRDLIQGMRYAHGIELHKTTVVAIQGETLVFWRGFWGRRAPPPKSAAAGWRLRAPQWKKES
jgi:hypothetical protein